jgi:N-acetylmuramoyl-L-alanine amidase
MQHLPRILHGAGIDVRRLRWGALLLIALGTLGSSLASDLAAPHRVTAVRFWSLKGVTRIAIETDGDFELKWDRLDNPDRLFFDLIGTRPKLSDKSITVIPVGDHLVQRIRVAEPQHDVTRVVLDLASPVESKTSRLDNPTRLMIELRAPGARPETTQAPVKPAAAPAESAPASKPVEHRQFTPPPAAQPVIPVVHPETAALETPPNLPPAVSVAANIAFDRDLVASRRPAAAAVLAKPASPPAIGPAIGAVSNRPDSFETALPAKRNSEGGRSMIRALDLKIGRIVLDPGHGGHDTGSVGPGGLREKDLVLDVAQKLGRLIQERMGSEVIFTRSDDTFVPLERRTEIANEAKADLFLSIHANSSPLRNAAGVETYYLNFTTSRSALDLAARENSGSQLTVYDLQGLLEKIALKDKVQESREFATRIQTALYSLSVKTDGRVRDRGVKKAPFVVLIGASMPSVLAEIGFVSNTHDENIMRREEYRERIAEALYKGISSYANSLSHFQVAQRH